MSNVLNPNTRFVCVRYGNVLASRGSAIPLFHDQIKNGGPVTLTVPNMTRFLLNLNQAVDTVFAALKEAKPGETYVPDAPSATILNIARALIGDRKIDIKITGIRPGEKMHEIMVSGEEAFRTVRRGNYYSIKPMLPELNGIVKNGQQALTSEFNSQDKPLTLDETIHLLKHNRLMVEDIETATNEKLLR